MWQSPISAIPISSILVSSMSSEQQTSLKAKRGIALILLRVIHSAEQNHPPWKQNESKIHPNVAPCRNLRALSKGTFGFQKCRKWGNTLGTGHSARSVTNRLPQASVRSPLGAAQASILLPPLWRLGAHL